MWRNARPDDDDRIVETCLELFREDPGPLGVTPEKVRRTLETLRREPFRGRAAVLEIAGRPEGHALLIPFWSNELGGEVCEVDELFVSRDHRRRGHGSALFDAIDRAQVWPSRPVAIALGVSPGNAAARRLYERLGFTAAGAVMVRRG